MFKYFKGIILISISKLDIPEVIAIIKIKHNQL